MKRYLGLLFLQLIVLTGFAQNKPYDSENVKQATLNIMKGKYDLAISNCNAELKVNPGCAYAYTLRGGVKLLLKDTINALQDINTAIKLDPKLALPYMYRSQIKLTHDKKGALEDITKAVELSPGDPLLYSGRGSVEWDMGMEKEAVADFKKSIEILDIELKKDPENGTKYFNRAVSKLMISDIVGACDDLEKAGKYGISQAKQYKDIYCK